MYIASGPAEIKRVPPKLFPGGEPFRCSVPVISGRFPGKSLGKAGNIPAGLFRVRVRGVYAVGKSP